MHSVSTATLDYQDARPYLISSFRFLGRMLASDQHFPGRAWPFQNGKMPGFFFRKRIERIDWKRLGNHLCLKLINLLASVDVCQVASQMNIDALQENLVSVAFCDITSEIVRNIFSLYFLFQGYKICGYELYKTFPTCTIIDWVLIGKPSVYKTFNPSCTVYALLFRIVLVLTRIPYQLSRFI